MKLLIIAALIAMAPVPVSAGTPQQHIPIQQVDKPDMQDVQAFGDICMAIATGKLTVQTVVDELNLDTKTKQQALVNECTLYLQGVEDGIASVHSDGPTT
jgi:hypothetical protein